MCLVHYATHPLLWLAQDDSKAAGILASHGHLEAAVKRLMTPYKAASDQGRMLFGGTSLADQALLQQLQGYCLSLGTTWALEQVCATSLSFCSHYALRTAACRLCRSL